MASRRASGHRSRRSRRSRPPITTGQLDEMSPAYLDQGFAPYLACCPSQELVVSIMDISSLRYLCRSSKEVANNIPAEFKSDDDPGKLAKMLEGPIEGQHVLMCLPSSGPAQARRLPRIQRSLCDMMGSTRASIRSSSAAEAPEHACPIYARLTALCRRSICTSFAYSWAVYCPHGLHNNYENSYRLKDRRWPAAFAKSVTVAFRIAFQFLAVARTQQHPHVLSFFGRSRSLGCFFRAHYVLAEPVSAR